MNELFNESEIIARVFRTQSQPCILFKRIGWYVLIICIYFINFIAQVE